MALKRKAVRLSGGKVRSFGMPPLHEPRQRKGEETFVCRYCSNIFKTKKWKEEKSPMPAERLLTVDCPVCDGKTIKFVSKGQ